MIRTALSKLYIPLLVIGCFFCILLYASWTTSSLFNMPENISGEARVHIDSCSIRHGILELDGWAFTEADMRTKTEVAAMIGGKYKKVKVRIVKRRDVAKANNLPLAYVSAMKGFTGSIYTGNTTGPIAIVIIVSRVSGEKYRGDYVCKV